MASVLIVDDEQPIRALIAQVLSGSGLELREAKDGIDALIKIDEEMPILMLLDLMMPRMDGWQVLEVLRERGLLEKIRVVVLTAAGATMTHNLAPYHVDAILYKPFEIEDFLFTIRPFIAGH